MASVHTYVNVTGLLVTSKKDQMRSDTHREARAVSMIVRTTNLDVTNSLVEAKESQAMYTHRHEIALIENTFVCVVIGTQLSIYEVYFVSACRMLCPTFRSAHARKSTRIRTSTQGSVSVSHNRYCRRTQVTTE